jgi:hypothetical protein
MTVPFSFVAEGVKQILRLAKDGNALKGRPPLSLPDLQRYKL